MTSCRTDHLKYVRKEPAASAGLTSLERGGAIVPVVIPYCAAASACEKGPAASAGLTPLTSEAAPWHRPGCDHAKCSYQCVREGHQCQQALLLLRAIRHHDIAHDVIAHSRAAVRA